MTCRIYRRHHVQNLGKGILCTARLWSEEYYAVGGFIAHALFRRYNPKDYKRMSLLQYSMVMFFVLSMVALPLKMAIRLGWHIKYVWITPWFNV